VETDKGRELRKAKINELEFGLRPDYKKIGNYRSDSYAFTKNNLNPLAGFGNVDLMLTGAFANSLFPVKSTVGYMFDASDQKKGDLIAKYGMDIMGLSQKSFNKIQKEIYAPEIIRYVKKRIGQ